MRECCGRGADDGGVCAAAVEVQRRRGHAVHPTSTVGGQHGCRGAVLYVFVLGCDEGVFVKACVSLCASVHGWVLTTKGKKNRHEGSGGLDSKPCVQRFSLVAGEEKEVMKSWSLRAIPKTARPTKTLRELRAPKTRAVECS